MEFVAVTMGANTMIFSHDDVIRMLKGLPRVDVQDDGYGGTFSIGCLVPVPRTNGPYVDMKSVVELIDKLEAQKNGT